MQPDSRIDAIKEILETTPVIPSLNGHAALFEDALSDLINPAEEIESGRVIASIGGIPLVEAGDFSVFLGKAKAGKSTILTALCAAVLGGTDKLNFSAVSPMRILYFDTEQRRKDAQKVVRRALKMAGFDSRLPVTQEQLKTAPIVAFQQRKRTPVQRTELIEFALSHSEIFGKFDMLVIDGIRDLVTSINDEEQATLSSSNLMRWSEEHDLHTVTVLHQNKGDNNARGHLGTEAMNKASLVVSVNRDEKDKDVREVKCELVRAHKEFEPFGFYFATDENGYVYPELTDAPSSISAPSKRPEDQPPMLLLNFLDGAFADCAKLNQTELMRLIGEKIGVGGKLQRSYVDYFQKINVITKEVGPRNSCVYSYEKNRAKILFSGGGS